MCLSNCTTAPFVNFCSIYHMCAVQKCNFSYNSFALFSKKHVGLLKITKKDSTAGDDEFSSTSRWLPLPF